MHLSDGLTLRVHDLKLPNMLTVKVNSAQLTGGLPNRELLFQLKFITHFALTLIACFEIHLGSSLR